jgi:hypothetical protein
MGVSVGTLAILAAGLSLAVFVPLADANSLHRSTRTYVTGHSGHTVYLKKGYSRRGPHTGPGLALPPMPETRSPRTTIMTATAAITFTIATSAWA